MKLEHVSKSFDGRRVIDDMSYEFAAGVAAILGPSGVGKSTLMNMLCGLEQPDAGRIERENGKTAVVFQDDRLLENCTAVENMLFVAGRECENEARALLGELGLADDLQKKVSEFSGGMKRRVAIARALIFKPQTLLMDEPFRGLDVETRAIAARCISSRRIATVIFVTHDEQEIELMHAQNVLRL